MNTPPRKRLWWCLAWSLALVLLAGCSKSNKDKADDEDKGIPEGPDTELLGADSKFIPRDAALFATVRLSDVMDTKTVRTLLAMVPRDEGVAKLEQHLGVSISDVRRMTFVAIDPDKTDWWIVIQTSKDFDRERILGTLTNPKKLEKPTEVKHGGKSYFVGHDNRAVYFVDAKQFITGPADGLKKCLALPAEHADGPLSEPLKLAAKKQYHAAVGVNVQSPAIQTALTKGGGKKDPIAAAMIASFTRTKTGAMTAILSDPIKLELTGNYGTESDAKDAAAALDGAIAAARIMLGGMAEKEPLAKQAVKLLKELKPVQDGKTVTLAADIDGDMLMGLMMMTTTRVVNDAERAVESRQHEASEATKQQNSPPRRVREEEEEESPRTSPKKPEADPPVKPKLPSLPSRKD